MTGLGVRMTGLGVRMTGVGRQDGGVGRQDDRIEPSSRHSREGGNLVGWGTVGMTQLARHCWDSWIFLIRPEAIKLAESYQIDGLRLKILKKLRLLDFLKPQERFARL